MGFGSMGLLCPPPPLCYASDSGVARICQLGGGGGGSKPEVHICKCHIIKGEVQSRITIISKESIKIPLQIGAKNDENRIRNKEVVTFWNFTFFRKTFLDQSFIQMSELMMSSPHNFLHISVTKLTKISYFSYENVNLALYPPKINEK